VHRACVAHVGGGFTASRYFVLPYNSDQIHPARLTRGQTEEHYKHAAHEKKIFNTYHSHWRSRVEHFFSRTLLGRFKCLKEWIWDQDMLMDVVPVLIATINLETWIRHGDKGRYELDMTEEDIAKLHNKAQHHVMQDTRYPYVDSKHPGRPLPFEKMEAEVKIAAAKKEIKVCTEVLKTEDQKAKEQQIKEEKKIKQQEKRMPLGPALPAERGYRPQQAKPPPREPRPQPVQASAPPPPSAPANISGSDLLHRMGKQVHPEQRKEIERMVRKDRNEQEIERISHKKKDTKTGNTERCLR